MLSLPTLDSILKFTFPHEVQQEIPKQWALRDKQTFP